MREINRTQKFPATWRKLKINFRGNDIKGWKFVRNFHLVSTFPQQQQKPLQNAHSSVIKIMTKLLTLWKQGKRHGKENWRLKNCLEEYCGILRICCDVYWKLVAVFFFLIHFELNFSCHKTREINSICRNAFSILCCQNKIWIENLVDYCVNFYYKIFDQNMKIAQNRNNLQIISMTKWKFPAKKRWTVINSYEN